MKRNSVLISVLVLIFAGSWSWSWPFITSDEEDPITKESSSFMPAMQNIEEFVEIQENLGNLMGELQRLLLGGVSRYSIQQTISVIESNIDLYAKYSTKVLQPAIQGTVDSHLDTMKEYLSYYKDALNNDKFDNAEYYYKLIANEWKTVLDFTIHKKTEDSAQLD